MIIHGHIANGQIVPHSSIALPDGAAVTIVVRDERAHGDSRLCDPMSSEHRSKYLAALARIDSVANENPGDSFRGADHDLALYGDQS